MKQGYTIVHHRLHSKVIPCKIIVDNYHSSNKVAQFDWPGDGDVYKILGDATVAIWHVRKIVKNELPVAVKAAVRSAVDSYVAIKKAKNKRKK